MEITFPTNPGSRSVATTAKAGLLFLFRYARGLMLGIVLGGVVLGKIVL
jgi:hypothetical protein